MRTNDVRDYFRDRERSKRVKIANELVDSPMEYEVSENQIPEVPFDPDNTNTNDDVSKKNDTFSFDFFAVAFFALAAGYMRFRTLDASDIVVWDEAHFGKFASYYIKRQFYFDVHPPLGKMTIAFIGWLFGYNGDFSFESGRPYDKDVPFAAMRGLSAAFGTVVVPASYVICRQTMKSRQVALFTAGCLLFDSFSIVLSRFILLDAPLLCFTVLAIMFQRLSDTATMENKDSISWKWMMCLGLSLGCAISTKWVGLLTYAYIGLLTIRDLWGLLPMNLNLSTGMRIKKFSRHVLARALCLIAVPFAVYVMSFVAHFQILNNSGTGDANMSSLFQATLENSPISNAPRFVAFESEVTLRFNGNRGGGLLHSHVQGYPTGSKQQQVTAYHHRDANNVWVIRKAWGDAECPVSEVCFLKNNDIIRLSHKETSKNLHSHSVPAPLSVFDNEVSAYGNLTIGDPNDHFQIIIIGDKNNTRIQTIHTSFLVKHVYTGCYLKSNAKTLPEWGFSQLEVSCVRPEPHIVMESLTWNVEGNKHSSLLSEQIVPQKNAVYTFWNNFVEINRQMWLTNNALVKKTSKRDILISEASDWFWLKTGIRMCNWKDETLKVYLFGNPSLWYAGSISLIAGMIFLTTHVVKRHWYAHSLLGWNVSHWFLFETILGYGMHYLPFFIMGRVLYLHHYLIAEWFSVLALGQLTDILVQQTNVDEYLVTTSILSSVIFSFRAFYPLVYGFVGPSSKLKNLQWNSGWKLAD